VRASWLLVLVVLAGCGHAKGAATPEPTTPKSSPRAAACGDLVSVAQQIGQALSGPGALDPRGPRATLRRLARRGPAEIRGDLRTLSRQFGLVAPAILAAYQRKPGAGKQMQRAVKRLEEKAVARANAHVTAWIQAHC
jgi:hypothetical protein